MRRGGVRRELLVERLEVAELEQVEQVSVATEHDPLRRAGLLCVGDDAGRERGTFARSLREAVSLTLERGRDGDVVATPGGEFDGLVRQRVDREGRPDRNADVGEHCDGARPEGEVVVVGEHLVRLFEERVTLFPEVAAGDHLSFEAEGRARELVGEVELTCEVGGLRAHRCALDGLAGPRVRVGEGEHQFAALRCRSLTEHVDRLRVQTYRVLEREHRHRVVTGLLRALDRHGRVTERERRDVVVSDLRETSLRGARRRARGRRRGAGGAAG